MHQMRKHTWKYLEIRTSLVCGAGTGATVHCLSKHRQVTRVGNISKEIPFLLLASQIIGKEENKCIVIDSRRSQREESQNYICKQLLPPADGEKQQTSVAMDTY